MSALALSVLLSLVSAVAYAGGAIVQEHVAVSSPDQEYAPLRRPSLVGRGGAERPGRTAARGGAGLRAAEPGAAAGRADDRVRPADGGAVRRPQGRARPPGGARSWRRSGLAGLLSLVGASDVAVAGHGPAGRAWPWSPPARW